MKRVRITKGSIGMVDRNGNYDRVITPGIHWLRLSETITSYDISQVYIAGSQFNLKLKDEGFKNAIEIMEIKENELVLQYKEGFFDMVLTTGKYFYWKSLVNFSFTKVSLDKIDITEKIDKSLLFKGQLSPFIQMIEIDIGEIGLLFLDGILDRKLTKGSYIFWKNNQKVKVVKVDLRQKQLEMSGQEILTKDKAALRVNFNSFYKVENIEKAILNTKNYEQQLYVVLQMALRELIGNLTLDELLENKESLSNNVKAITNDKVKNIGIELIDCGVKDIILPGDVKEIMNQVLVAQKRAQANIITRREETASTRSLLNTAKLMEDNSMLFKLKEMEYVEKISEKIGEISLSGGGQILDQMKVLFSTTK